MSTNTALLDTPREGTLPPRPHPEPLLREALGDALKSFRMDKGVTLRELAETACVSPGYLSELERGRKEVSSELLASVCHALGVSVSDVLIEAAGSMALQSVAEELVRV
ncbi:helix-turn-helix domain-containing protein [Corynebacterium uropygiale]|uniref:Helix-turn-helix domain-containing protein n=1 Tax=Corynebacterium uropygiale TaxID=1775911 RepID=A0A9X1QN63_9CORY|nr:helix-turn-helix transcriptional regulator [Corynebacterium uropygiale]MCF4006447.1 helix-turn-helix domain-containing protein [Corynebacterium uropygiale]